MSASAPLTYDIVIATRNRADALALSLPLFLSQSRLPGRVIIVDSSDDPAPVDALIDDIARSAPVPLSFQHSAAGSSLQRNIGLRDVSADVAFFPDDDSLVLPGALEAMMRIYERDEEGHVGGVCSAEAMTAPGDMLHVARSTYRMTAYERFKQKTNATRYAFERRFIPDPFLTHGRSRWDVRPVPSWLDKENAVLVEYMTGFRMSFRSDVIRRVGFHELLGAYALCEDVDASFQVMKTHLLVGARNAQIFHYKVPGARASGRRLGVMNVLNRAYVLLRATGKTSPAAGQLRRYCLYKLAQYAGGIDSRFGRDRLAGALAAYRALPALFAASDDDLEATFIRLRDACLAG